jgi:hypothetical protein
MTGLFERLEQRRIADSSQTGQIEPEKILRGPLLPPVVPPADRQSSPSEKLLDWLVNHWPGATVSARDIYRFGPPFILNNPKGAIAQAEILTANGWLTPIKSWRRDRKEWRIARGPNK